MAQAHKVVSTVQSAVVDRRAHNIRYRQNELSKLHSQLREHTQELLDAIAKDSSTTQTEARAEFVQTMQSVREAYDRLDNTAAHEEEYSVTRGRSNLARRTPLGLVVIRPSTFSRLYSIIQPLVVAISSGNCTIVEIPKTCLATDAVLKAIIRSSLDSEAYAVIESSISPSELPSDVFLIEQKEVSSTKVAGLYSNPHTRTLAVVDRTARLLEAAQSIAYARLLFSGKSPYAPDLVLVNEFIKDAFVEAMSKSINAISSRWSSNAIDRESATTLKALKGAEEVGDCSILHSSGLKVVEILNRDSILLETKVTGSHVLLLSVRSLTDAAVVQSKFPNLLAGYYFGHGGAAKFLSQAVSADASFINHIPHSLLVGPAAPSDYPLSLINRYTSEMLTKPHPEYVELSKKQETEIAWTWNENNLNLLHNVVQPLKPTGQRSGTTIGFFDQGILTGLTLIVLPVLATTCSLAYVGGRYAVGHLANVRY